MNFWMVGIDHSRAPVAVRERVYLSRLRAVDLAKVLVAEGHVRGAVILSTCARTEIYGETDHPDALLDVFRRYGKDVFSYIRALSGQEAVVHLFSLVAGLDSPVFGDQDVVHQVREAYATALEAGTSSSLVSRIFERSLAVGKRLRTTFRIGEKDTTAAALAVERAVQEHAGLLKGNVHVMGTGVVGIALVAALRQHDIPCTIVANRNFERARLLAREHGCQVLRLDEFYDDLSGVDVVFAATACPHPIVTTETFKARVPPGKPMAIFDLAVPRDFEEGIAACSGVSLYTIDDLGSRAAKDLEVRVRAMLTDKAQRFLEKEGYCA